MDHESDTTSMTATPENEMLTGMQEAAVEACKLLRSIGSPYRLMILCLLMESEKTARPGSRPPARSLCPLFTCRYRGKGNRCHTARALLCR